MIDGPGGMGWSQRAHAGMGALRDALRDALWSALRRSRPTVPLGAGRGDDRLLADSLPLAHLTTAIVGGAQLRAGQLQDAQLDFVCAPDPTAWLQAMQAGNPPPASAAVPLRLLCWNLALLNVYVAGRPYKSSPFVDQRRGPVFDRLLAAGADIILLQELWHPPEVDELRLRADAAGYHFCCPPRAHVDGLAVLLKKGCCVGAPDVQLRPYAVQDRVEALALPSKEQFLRSWLQVSFEHPQLGPITVFDTHMQAYPKSWRARLQQSRSLGLEVARRPSPELVFVGGDLNAGPFYARQAWRKPDGTIDGDWWHDALSLPVLHHYGGLSDLALRGRSAADADLEVRLSRLLDNDPVAALKAPLGCSAQHLRAFTGTDCNSLYFQQYAGTEQPARLDHVLARDPTGRIHVSGSQHRFAERDVAVPGQLVEASDHYAVQVDLQVAPS